MCKLTPPKCPMRNTFREFLEHPGHKHGPGWCISAGPDVGGFWMASLCPPRCFVLSSFSVRPQGSNCDAVRM
jgi:hypothetical protein